MQLLNYLNQNPVFFYILITILGLLVGSFLNVVIYRLPIMMHRQWREECQAFLELDKAETDHSVFNLSVPRSRCPHCNHLITAIQNIPVLSFLALKGKCANCKTPISIRYPLIEILTAALSALVAWKFGVTLALPFALVFTWLLISLSMIDIDQQLLLDVLTLPLLWLGLLFSISGTLSSPEASIIGAAAGYLSLWSVYQLFKHLTGKEGMGYGDFKLLAALGAWLGWSMLPAILLLAASSGAIIGSIILFAQKQGRNTTIPFGPYLAIAGWVALIWQQEIQNFYYVAG